MRIKKPAASRMRETAALVFAMTFPSVMTWIYFVVLAGGDHVNPLQRLAYSTGKTFQFTFPILFLVVGERIWPRPRRPRFTGLGLGIGFGLLVTVAMFGLYFAVCRDSAVFARTAAQLARKLGEAGLSSTAAFVGLAAFVVVVHSLLEEYYWRWFVFGRLRRLLPLVPAVVLSSLAFMAHHVIVLNYYFPDHFFELTVPLSLGVAIGGGVWAVLYERTGSIYSPWVSHLIVDAAIFGIGWDLLGRTG